MRKLSTRERGTGFQRDTEWARAAALHAREPEFKFWSTNAIFKISDFRSEAENRLSVPCLDI